MDTNWFYSTLAQSAAAIVGLLGAIVIAELLRQREVAARWSSRLSRSAQRVREQAAAVLRPRTMFIELWESRIGAALNGPLPTRVTLPALPTFAGATIGPHTLEIGHADRDTFESLLADAKRLSDTFAPEALRRSLRSGWSGSLELRTIADAVERAETAEQLWAGTSLEPLVRGSASVLRTLLIRTREDRVLREQARAALALTPLRGSVIAMAIIALIGILHPLTQLAAPSEDAKIRSVLLFGACLVGLLAFLWLQVGALGSVHRTGHESPAPGA